MQETRPDFPPRHRYAVCTLESDACVEVAVWSLIEYMLRRKSSMGEAQGFLTSY
jgi:hypothetical protein